jgi:hypothetical protein
LIDSPATPLVTENFTNDVESATTGNMGYLTLTTHSPNRPLTVHYDAAAKSYTLQLPGRASWTFAPADIQPGGDPNTVVYVAYDLTAFRGATEQLVLTKNSASTYTYVGAGLWTRVELHQGYTDDTETAFTYGVETPDAAVPRTGTGTYTVQLGGLMKVNDPAIYGATSGTTFGLSGTGLLTANFASNFISADGRLYVFDPATLAQYGSDMPWNATAAIYSTTNNFNGSFTVGGPRTLAGEWGGRFYGPAAEELGGSFYAGYANGTPENIAVVGAILGKRGAISSTTFDSFAGWSAAAASLPGTTTFAPELTAPASPSAATTTRAGLLRDVVPDLHGALRDARPAGAGER